jgi:hypothetical protein
MIPFEMVVLDKLVYRSPKMALTQRNDSASPIVSDQRTRAAGTRQSADGRQRMQKQDGQIAHGTILSRSGRPLETLTNLAIRHAQVDL